jgi:hypothetical protein
MKSFFLTVLIFMMIGMGYALNFNKKITRKKLESRSLISNDNPISEIEDNDFILSTIEDKISYNTVKGQFNLKITSERLLTNRFNNSRTDKEITFSLFEDPSTVFSYYLSTSKSVFLKGIIYTDKIVFPRAVKVGMNRIEIGQVFNCVLDSNKNVFRIYDADGLIEIVLNFNPSGKIFAIEVNTSGYVS